MKVIRRVIDHVGCVVVWTVGLSVAGAVLGLLIVKGMVQQNVQEAPDAVRHTEHPTCTKRSCPLPGPFWNRSGTASEPER